MSKQFRVVNPATHLRLRPTTLTYPDQAHSLQPLQTILVFLLLLVVIVFAAPLQKLTLIDSLTDLLSMAMMDQGSMVRSPATAPVVCANIVPDSRSFRDIDCSVGIFYSCSELLLSYPCCLLLKIFSFISLDFCRDK